MQKGHCFGNHLYLVYGYPEEIPLKEGPVALLFYVCWKIDFGFEPKVLQQNVGCSVVYRKWDHRKFSFVFLFFTPEL